MIDVVGALIDDTGAVELHGRGIEDNGDGGNGNGGSEGLLISLRKSLVGLHLDNLLASRIVATTVLSSVGIVVLSAETDVLGVVEGRVRPATRATVVGILGTLGAVDDLLLREEGHDTGLDVVGGLKGTGGGEGPAGTAGTLVLDGGNSSLLSPINGLGDVVLDNLVLDFHIDGLGAAAELSGELVGGQIGELVGSHLEGRGGGVVGVDDVEVVLEDLLTVTRAMRTRENTRKYTYSTPL